MLSNGKWVGVYNICRGIRLEMIDASSSSIRSTEGIKIILPRSDVIAGPFFFHDARASGVRSRAVRY